ncbi:hypothetical protein EC973_002336 [Apophysomyces ossiformis]|uniref:Uncharacterized protein n=1 Tax=Apophysomyces ossiformis TaxID=679940 RepID=A0A8H7BN12_9FUNG|nr:hypothetical protein EC973_002336 [Apophysomyces ossiformis]
MLFYLVPLTVSICAYPLVTAFGVQSCPPLPKRDPPTSVHDLRPDDIKVIGAIGDSITAGLLAKNIDTEYATLKDIREYRGLSGFMGVSEGTVSVANYIKHYSPYLVGGSDGTEQLPICPGIAKEYSDSSENNTMISNVKKFIDTFFCLDAHHNPQIDHLNAAISSASSKSIDEQVDYLVKYIGRGTAAADDWKLVNVFLGTNDVAASCLPGFDMVSYRNRMKAGIQRLIDKVDKVLVNIVGIFHMENIPAITKRHPDYRKPLIVNTGNNETTIDLQDYECVCRKMSLEAVEKLLTGKEHLAFLNSLTNKPAEEAAIYFLGLQVDLANTMLREITAEFALTRNDRSAVVFQPFNVAIDTVPVQALSNIDGYHPDILGQSFIGTSVWNQMFRPSSEKLSTIRFDEKLSAYCPKAEDRFQTA